MKEIPLTQGKIAIVDDEDFEWLNQWKWAYHHSGYAVRTIYIASRNRKQISMHRLINGTPDGIETDHINHNRLDNRRGNLRNCTHLQNQHNFSMPKSNTSGYKGVDWHKPNHKWRAQIKFHGKKIHIGFFKNIGDAASAYETKAKELFGEFMNGNQL